MDLHAPNVGFVVAAYGISAVVLIGLAIKTIVFLKTQERQLTGLEERQARRRGSVHER
ncbi:MAG TPA: heme exporter protein CcmD [Aestuariivirgaceae bacterium]|jgi:heme exporter protein CcmD